MPGSVVQYAASGDVSIAYRVVGQGPPDLVLLPGFLSHLELSWEFPPQRRFAERLASFSRLVLLDKRGTGMSDRVSERDMPTLEQRVDDIGAVMNAVGLDSAALLGISDGGMMAAMFAATHPNRSSALILYGTGAYADRQPTEEEFRERSERIRREWGSEAADRMLQTNGPSVAGDPQWQDWMRRMQALSASPGAVAALRRMNAQIDLRPVLPAIRVPTLVLHRLNDQNVPIEHARLVAASISGARLVELPGGDHFPFAGDQDSVVDEIQEFLTGVRDPEDRRRVLATVVFTDLVNSTARALELGDRRWRELLERHHALVRRELERFRGREIDTAGDGFLTSFDGPARAVRFASSVVDRLGSLDLIVRAGVHTGECEIHDEKLAGVAVHVGARIAALAGPGEVLVSGTVRDLVAGSGLEFEDRGEHVLRGLQDTRRVFALHR